jgi:phosphoserine phosphatase RsbU/P
VRAPQPQPDGSDVGHETRERRLSAADLYRILKVTQALASPFDLTTMLAEVVNAAKQVLDAERGSVWLYDDASDELVLKVATGLDSVRLPAGKGLVGICARTKEIVNVPDCYADPRFDPEVDKATGYRTRCLLTLPLVDLKGALVGVLQVLNKAAGSFDADDEALAMALAAQCAVALQRVRMTEAVIEGERLRQELEMARTVQLGTLPSTMPSVRGYDVFGTFAPAELTGGDTFDLAVLPQGLLVVLADATGHGIAPALSVTQMQAMVRMAFRMGADLETAFVHVNNGLAETLADDRFVTAFIGLLDPARHALRFHSGGQAPILHFQAASGTCAHYDPTSFPLAAMPLASMRPAVVVEMQPGDIVALLSDGIYEYRDGDGAQFGEERVEALLREHRNQPMAALSARLFDAVRAFARGAPQEDDMTVVLVKREPAATAAFGRGFHALQALFGFTDGFFSRHAVDKGLLPTVDLAVEELFTNMVKYSPGGGAEIRLDIATVPGGVEVTLTDYDVEPFDVARAPAVDVDLPIEQRRPGGLGLHLLRQMLDRIDYDYSPDDRVSRITFRKTTGGTTSPGHGAQTGSGDVRD